MGWSSGSRKDPKRMRWDGLRSGERVPRNRRAAMASAEGPLMRTTAIADSPGAVAGATMVSFSTFADAFHGALPFAADDDPLEEPVADAGAGEGLDLGDLEVHHAALDRGERLRRDLVAGLAHFLDQLARQLAQALDAAVAVARHLHLDARDLVLGRPGAQHARHEMLQRRQGLPFAADQELVLVACVDPDADSVARALRLYLALESHLLHDSTGDGAHRLDQLGRDLRGIEGSRCGTVVRYAAAAQAPLAHRGLLPAYRARGNSARSVRRRGRVAAPGFELHGTEASQGIRRAARIDHFDRELPGAHTQLIRRLMNRVAVTCRFDLDGIAHVRSLHGWPRQAWAAILRSSARFTRYCWMAERTLFTVQYRTTPDGKLYMKKSMNRGITYIIPFCAGATGVCDWRRYVLPVMMTGMRWSGNPATVISTSGAERSWMYPTKPDARSSMEYRSTL